MKTDFIPIDYDYFDFENRNYVKIIGRNSSGKRICILDTCPIYLWAILKDRVKEKKIQELIKKIQKIKIKTRDRETKVEKVELHEKNFLGKPVNALKIFATNYKDLHDIADHLAFAEIEKRRGYDLGFTSHYVIEKKLLPLQWYEIEGEEVSNSQEFGGLCKVLDVDFCVYLNNHTMLKDQEFKPKVLAYDIEADEFKIGEGEILMVSLVSDNFNKVITWKKNGDVKADYIEYVKDEAELLESFIKNVKEISPDFLVGYFSDGFDLPYLKVRADKNKIKFSLGLDESQPRFYRGAIPTGKISGIVHIDLLKFIQTAYSQYMQSETLSLNEVAKEFLGDSKKDFKFQHSSKLEDHQWKKYFEYNLHDSVLNYKLFEKFWPDLLEFTRIIQEPIFDISRNGMSNNVEDFIIHNLNKFNEIPEKKPGHDDIVKRRERKPYEGAFVFEPKPGLYEDIAVFDFTSYWPSIIVTYNLSKSTFLEKKEKNSTEVNVEKKFYFTKKPGFFPQMLKEIIEKRKQYKAELKVKSDPIKTARSNAFKLLANASYGYQGFFGARYYCPEASASVTAIGRDLTKKTINQINKHDYTVIYSDTDSISFKLNKNPKKQALELLKEINSTLPGIIELDLEGFFKRGIWVTKRSGDIGAKKKYALIDENKRLKIRGFETVRRDWCNLAREVQNKILNQILEDGNEKNALKYFKEIVKKIKSREFSIEEFTIRTQLKKPLSEYKTISPHVIAAKRMNELDLPISSGTLVEYYIAETGKKDKLVRDKVKLPNEPGEYNIQYYLEHQILPAVENIFQVFNLETKEIIDGKRQTKLCDF